MVEKLIFLTKIFIFLVGILSSYYVVGYIVSYWLKFKRRVSRNLLMGFIFQIALFELVALPFILRKGSFSAMVACYLFILGVFYILGIGVLIYLYRKKEMESPVVVFRKWIAGRRQEKCLGISFFGGAFALLLLVHLAGVTGHQITMGDDAYYVSLATYAIDHDTLEMNTTYITTGLLSLEDIRPNISAWEYYVGCLSVVFHFHPAQMFHFLLPLILIPMSYMAYYEVIRELFASHKRAPYLMWYALLNLFFSFSAKLNSYNMFNCLWMGKVVLYNILMPMFLATCINIMKAQRETLKYWICVVFIMIAGICATVVGVYMIPIYYAAIGITYAVTIRSWEEFRKLLLPVAITVVPVVAVVVIVFATDAGKNILAYSQAESKNWLHVFLNYWGIDAKPVLGCVGLTLFIVSVIAIWIRENRIVRTVLCGLTVFAGLTLVNPLFIQPVSSYLTGADLYWRMFIIVPVVYVLPYLLVEWSLHLQHRQYSYTAAAMLVIAVVGTTLNGSAFADKKIFRSYQTTYGINEKCVAVSDYILKKSKGEEELPTVLYPPALREGLRQYTTRLNTWMGRMYYHGGIETEYGDMRTVCHNIYHEEYSEDQTYQVLKSLDIDYIVVRKRIHYTNKEQFTKMKRFGKYVVYRVN